jgi:competence protein ComEC
VALTAQLATFPLAVYYFQQFPTYFLVANPLVVALSTAMLPIALAAIAVSWVPFVAEMLGWVLTGITWLLNESVVLTEKLPFSVVSGLSFSWTELALVYVIIGLLLALWYYQDWRWLWGAGLMSVVLLVEQMVEIREYHAQKGLVIHAVPKQTVISLIDGERAVLLADSGFFQRDKRPYNFYLKNFYNERGIQRVTPALLQLPSKQSKILKTLPFGKLIVWQGCKILLVEQPITEAIPPVADYVLIRNTAFRKSEQLRTFFGNQRLIFDNSNKFYVLDTLQKQAITHKLPWYFVGQKGAFVLHF